MDYEALSEAGEGGIVVITVVGITGCIVVDVVMA